MAFDILKSYNDVVRRNRNLRDSTFAESVAPVSQSMFRTTFAANIAANGVDPSFFTQIGPLGTGIGYSQTGGNLVITSGTTANAELILRSVDIFSGPHELRWQSILSQRIANNNFVIELVDVIADNIPFVINSATSITLTIPRSPFTSLNVGQSVSIGAFNTAAAAIPGRYAIASVSGNAVTFTVAGFPASGSGTCSAFGWNFHRCVYSGATATSIDYDSGRRGYASGNTTATINTTASPGHMGIMVYEDGMAALLDQLVASATSLATTQRASRVVNLPDENATLYLQIRCTNGSTAPASTTTWTVGMVSMTEYQPVTVAITTTRPQPANAATGVQILGGTLPTVTTVSTVSNVAAIAAGANLIGDVGIQYRATGGALSATNTHFVAASSTNATSVKASAGKVFGWYFANTTAAWRYVKLHNQATLPTAGAGVFRTVGVPPNGVASFFAEGGIPFATGIGLTMVTGAADADATAVTASDIVGELFWV